MDRTVYKTKIDWWIPAVFIFTVTVAFIGPLIDGEIFIVGIIIATLLCALEIAMFGSVKIRSDPTNSVYAIRSIAGNGTP